MRTKTRSLEKPQTYSSVSDGMVSTLSAGTWNGSYPNNIAANLLYFIRPRAFVKVSAKFSQVTTCSILNTPELANSLTKWYLIPMCLVLCETTGFLAILIAAILSEKMVELYLVTMGVILV